MNVRKKNITLLLFILIVTSIIGFIYWMWVKSIALPMIGEMDPFEVETITEEKYEIGDGKIKIVFFADNECDQMCQEVYENLYDTQERLIEYGSFGSVVEMLVVVNESHANRTKLAEDAEKYSMNEDGWNHVLFSPSDHNQVLNQFPNATEQGSTVYLVDAKRKIRQTYDMSGEGEQEQIVKDITQLIRLQHQSIDHEG